MQRPTLTTIALSIAASVATLPRVVVAARRALPVAAGGSALQPVMQRRGL